MARRGLGPVLRALRKTNDMGLRELARKAKVPPGYLAELEAGKKTNPSLDVLQRLAKALGVSVTALTRKAEGMASSGVLFDSKLVYDDGRVTPKLMVWTTLRGFGRQGATPVEVAAALQSMGLAKGRAAAVASTVEQMLEEMISWSAQRRIKRVGERFRASLESE